MKTKFEYTIISGYDYQLISGEIQELLNDRWELNGHLIVTPGVTVHYTQSLIKKTEVSVPI